MIYIKPQKQNELAKLIIYFICLIAPLFAYSSNAVDKELNYIHNGGLSYPIKLKLYKHCALGAAIFQERVTINIRGNNTYTLGKDIIISLGKTKLMAAKNEMPCNSIIFRVPMIVKKNNFNFQIIYLEKYIMIM